MRKSGGTKKANISCGPVDVSYDVDHNRSYVIIFERGKNMIENLKKFVLLRIW